jgi:hypothetical protein
MAEAAAPSLPIMPNTENVRKIRDVVLEKEKADTGPSEGGSLTDLSGEFGDALKPATDMLARIRNVLDNINGSIAFLSGQLLDAMSADKESKEAAAAEASVEGARVEETPIEDAKEPQVNFVEKSKSLIDSIFGALGTLLAGKVLYDFFAANFPELKMKIDAFFENIIAGIRTFAVPAFVGGVAKIFSGVTGFIKTIGASLGLIDTTMDVGKAVGPITKAFQGIGRFISTLGKLVPFASKLPGINLIFAIIDIFKGFKAGEEEYGGILGGLVGSVEGLLKGFIGMPINLLTKGIAFILEKLGFENIAKGLKDFDAVELIGNLVGGIVKFFKNFIENVKKIINAILSKFGFGGEKSVADMTPEEQEKAREKIADKAPTSKSTREFKSQAIEEAAAEFEKENPGKENPFTSKKFKRRGLSSLTKEQQKTIQEKIEEKRTTALEKFDEQVVQAKTQKVTAEKVQVQAAADKVGKSETTGTGSELKEKGQDPKAVAVSQTNAGGTTNNIDQSTTNNNTSVAGGGGKSAPDISTKNNDNSLIEGTGSTNQT